jgi:GDP-L-fucose synthase
MANILCNTGACVKIVSLDRIKVNEKAEHIFGDLADFGFCRAITEDMDLVFHLTGVKSSIQVTKAVICFIR